MSEPFVSGPVETPPTRADGGPRRRRPHAQEPQEPQEPTDAELDRYIRTRLSLIGVDLSVLPEDDSSAPADQARILRSVRRLLRGTVPALSRYSLDPQEFPPSMYPAHLAEVRMREAAEGPNP